MELDFDQQAVAVRIGLMLALAVIAHVTVRVIQFVTVKLRQGPFGRASATTRTAASLFSGALIFAVYATALGYILVEIGVSIQTYLASVSIIGLALAFGAQGLVQDVVTGLTIIFANVFDEGDMVEIGGQTGSVERLGMRFTVLSNALGAVVYIPNRSIGNVTAYPRGHMQCVLDVTISETAEMRQQMEERARSIILSAVDQFPTTCRGAPIWQGIQTSQAGRAFMRVVIPVWPGRGQPIETSLKQELVNALKAIDPSYADWMIALTYDIGTRNTLAAMPLGRG